MIKNWKRWRKREKEHVTFVALVSIFTVTEGFYTCHKCPSILTDSPHEFEWIVHTHTHS